MGQQDRNRPAKKVDGMTEDDLRVVSGYLSRFGTPVRKWSPPCAGLSAESNRYPPTLTCDFAAA